MLNKWRNKLRLTKQVNRWMLIAVGSSLLAILLAIGFEIMIGNNINQIKLNRLEDFFLVVYSLAVNVYVLNKESFDQKIINKDTCDNCSLLSGLIIIIYICLYSFVYNRVESFAIRIINYLIYISLGSILLNLCIGTFLVNETEDYKKTQNIQREEQEKKQEKEIEQLKQKLRKLQNQNAASVKKVKKKERNRKK